jgi:hypothetical protein
MCQNHNITKMEEAFVSFVVTFIKHLERTHSNILLPTSNYNFCPLQKHLCETSVQRIKRDNQVIDVHFVLV